MDLNDNYAESLAFDKRFHEVMGTILSADPVVAEKIKAKRFPKEDVNCWIYTLLSASRAETVAQVLSISPCNIFGTRGVGPVACEKFLAQLERACTQEGLSLAVTKNNTEAREFYFKWKKNSPEERTSDFWRVKAGRSFTWGTVDKLYEFGPYTVAKYGPWDAPATRQFHLWIEHKDTGRSYRTLEAAMAGAIAFKEECHGTDN